MKKYKIIKKENKESVSFERDVEAEYIKVDGKKFDDKNIINVSTPKRYDSIWFVKTYEDDEIIEHIEEFVTFDNNGRFDNILQIYLDGKKILEHKHSQC